MQAWLQLSAYAFVRFSILSAYVFVLFSIISPFRCSSFLNVTSGTVPEVPYNV